MVKLESEWIDWNGDCEGARKKEEKRRKKKKKNWEAEEEEEERKSISMKKYDWSEK